MYKILFVLGIAISKNLGAGPAEQGAVWLEKADRYRLVAGSVKVETRIQLFKHEKLKRSRLYHVYIKSGRRSLVLFKSPGEIGQKVLMRDQRFHLFLPKSKRAIRITPMQRLLGEASVGDIATMTWHEDYTVESVLKNQDKAGRHGHYLILRARHNTTPYQKIELFISQENYFPLYASLYLKSGKIAKQAEFLRGKGDQYNIVVGMVLIDLIQHGEKTHIEYIKMQPQSIPDKYYHPSFLLQNRLD